MADGGIDFVAREVHQLVGVGQPQRKCRVRELEAAEPSPPIGWGRRLARPRYLYPGELSSHLLRDIGLIDGRVPGRARRSTS